MENGWVDGNLNILALILSTTFEPRLPTQWSFLSWGCRSWLGQEDSSWWTGSVHETGAKAKTPAKVSDNINFYFHKRTTQGLEAEVSFVFLFANIRLKTFFIKLHTHLSTRMKHDMESGTGSEENKEQNKPFPSHSTVLPLCGVMWRSPVSQPAAETPHVATVSLSSSGSALQDMRPLERHVTNAVRSDFKKKGLDLWQRYLKLCIFNIVESIFLKISPNNRAVRCLYLHPVICYHIISH